jgi:hypothetical protein
VRNRTLALLGLLLSCREATQIAVVLRGEGFECAPTDRPTSFVGSSLLAAPQLARVDPGAAPRWTDCTSGAPSDDRVELGDVVLVPAGARGGPVEIVAFASIETAQGSTPIDRCVELWDGYRNDPASVPEDDDGEGEFDRCIVARRSLGFIAHSSLRLEIPLSSACAGVYCPPSQTCVAGECKNSATVCGPEGCELQGGAGPEGGGGAAGGAGGAGGTGGTGGANVVWQKLPDLSGTPLDVVLLDDGPELQFWIAAGNVLHHVTVDGDGRPVNEPISGATNDFLRVADDGARVAAIGRNGIWRSDQAQAGPVLPMGWPAAGGEADRFDVAWGHAPPDSLYWALGPNAVAGPCGAWPAGFFDSMQCSGPAFARATIAGAPVVSLVQGGKLRIQQSSGNTNDLDLGETSREWSLWLRSTEASGVIDGLAAKGEAPAQILRFRLGGGSVASYGSSREIRDLGVLEVNGDLELFAIDATGLFRTSIPADVGSPPGDLAWTDVDLPPMIPQALWVGFNAMGQKPRIVVVGTQNNQGVAYWANLDELAP